MKFKATSLYLALLVVGLCVILYGAIMNERRILNAERKCEEKGLEAIVIGSKYFCVKPETSLEPI